MTKNTTLIAAGKERLAISAFSGLQTGLTGQSTTSANKHFPASAGAKTHYMGADAHQCKGQNACKGQGGCKSGDNGCKGKNSCKGKGGCKSGK
jgi:hypothetical protein